LHRHRPRLTALHLSFTCAHDGQRVPEAITPMTMPWCGTLSHRADATQPHRYRQTPHVQGSEAQPRR
jgi:hypothetical protein